MQEGQPCNVSAVTIVAVFGAPRGPEEEEHSVCFLGAGMPMEAYELGKRIGRGNYGSVYVAKDKRNARWYCLKMIMMEAHSDEERGACPALPTHHPTFFGCFRARDAHGSVRARLRILPAQKRRSRRSRCCAASTTPA